MALKAPFLHGRKRMLLYANIPTCVKKHTLPNAHQLMRLSVNTSRSESAGPSFHYLSLLPDTYNPITLYTSALAEPQLLYTDKHPHPKIRGSTEQGHM